MDKAAVFGVIQVVANRTILAAVGVGKIKADAVVVVLHGVQQQQPAQVTLARRQNQNQW